MWRENKGAFTITLQNSDSVAATVLGDYELIPKPFAIASGVTVPVGGYDYQSGQLSYKRGIQHKLSGAVTYQDGALYGGRKRTVGFATARLELSPQLGVEPIISANWVALPWGDFTTTVLSVRCTYTMTPRMLMSALIQHNSSTRTLSINARFRWEYRPGSELFVVYNDGRDETVAGFPQVANRAFVVKINRLLRF